MFPSDVELWFDWHLTNRCNFFCHYCHPQIRYVLNKEHLDEPTPKVCAAAFDRLNRTCGILMSGGEPFAFPDFVELSERLTKRHYIAINTNLSMTEEIRDFSQRVPVSRVARILAATHVEERERLDFSLEQFATNFRLLRDSGYQIDAAYVLHPNTLHRATEDFHRLEELGVDRLQGKVFKGIWEKRRFPTEYSVDELVIVRKLIKNYRVGAAYIARQWDFRGLPCGSGMRSFKIRISGDVQRCVSVPGSLGNLYDGTFRPLVESTTCTARHVLVLSECAEHLVQLPVELASALPAARAEEND